MQASINPAFEAPGYPSTPIIPVSWSCKKVNEIDLSLFLQIGRGNQMMQLKITGWKNNSATAIYNGSDK